MKFFSSKMQLTDVNSVSRNKPHSTYFNNVNISCFLSIKAQWDFGLELKVS